MRVKAGSMTLANGTKPSKGNSVTLSLNQVLDGLVANLAFPLVAIDLQFMSEVSRLTVCLGKVLQRGTTLCDCR